MEALSGRLFEEFSELELIRKALAEGRGWM